MGAIRAQELDSELADRRYQCEMECKTMVQAQTKRNQAVFDALEKLGPDEIAAAADARNVRLKSEVQRLREEIEELKARPPTSGTPNDSKASDEKAPERASGFIEGLLSFDDDSTPARDPTDSPFDSEKPSVDTAAKLQ